MISLFFIRNRFSIALQRYCFFVVLAIDFRGSWGISITRHSSLTQFGDNVFHHELHEFYELYFLVLKPLNFLRIALIEAARYAGAECQSQET